MGISFGRYNQSSFGRFSRSLVKVMTLTLNVLLSIYSPYVDLLTQQISSQSHILYGRYKQFPFDRFLRSYVKVMTLTWIFLYGSIPLKEIYLHTDFEVNPT